MKTVAIQKAFAYGPAAGILIELVKHTLQLFTSSTGGIGELANFIMGSIYAARPADCFFRRVYSVHQKQIGCCAVQCLPI